jgi:uncharacterized protein YfdQ (DUF2303 family)
MSEATDVKELVEAAHRLPVKLETTDGRTLFALPAPQGAYTLQDATLPNAATVSLPKLLKQHVQIQTAGSLKTYVNRFKNDDSMLFADVGANIISAVIDYHEAPLDVKDAKPVALHGVHVATLTLPYSKEWMVWTHLNEKLMSQVDFANFLEENGLDLFEPSGGELLDMCRDLQVTDTKHFDSSVRMGNLVKFTYKKDESATTSQEMELPSEFTIAIPVYFNETPVHIRCLMRRKINDGDLSLGYKMVRLENVRQDEFKRIADNVQFDTAVTMVSGKRA